MKQKIVSILKLLIYATFFVPLLVLPMSFIFPFIVPKILMFRALVTLMIGGYVLLLFINWQEFKPRFSWLSLTLAAFFVSFATSTFVGVDPYHSFWDNHERMLGLFTIFHFVAYYFICSSVFKSWTEWNKALKIFLAAGSLVMFVGILQIFNPHLLLNQGAARVASTLGNPIYVGGYGLFLTFVAFLLFIKEKSKSWKWAEAAAGVLAALGMVFSGTRGSILGLAVGLAVLILIYIVVLKEQTKTRNVLAVVAAFGVLLVSLLYVFRQTEFVSNIPAVGRAINTTYTVLKSTARWVAWEVALDSWKERPVFGWGPNNFFYAFNKYYQPRSLEFGYGETWFDNAHNIIVNTLAVQGAVGLIAYLAIFIVGIAVLIVSRRKRMLDPHIFAVAAAFLVAHLVQNVTVFENPTSYLYFMFWLAMINSVSIKKEEPVNAGVKNNGKAANLFPNKTIGTGTVVTTGVIVLLLIFIFEIQPARANMKALDALKYLTNQPVAGLEVMKAALAFNAPHIDDIRSDLSRTVSQVLSGGTDKLGKDKSAEMLNVALEAMQANVVLHPYDIRNYLTLSQLSQAGYALTGDIKYIGQYGTYLETALIYSPKRQQIIYNLANFYLQISRFDDSVKLLQQTIDDDPKIAEGYWRLAYMYKLSGKTDKAKEILGLAEKNNAIFSDTDKEIFKQILADLPAATGTKKK
ncbi:MAG: O-antigen ligase family protein [Patescibacteria group bacterium]